MKQIELYENENGKCYVHDYLHSLTDKQNEKVEFVFDLICTQPQISSKYLTKLKETEDIWEIRVQLGNNIFRFLGFLTDEETLIILNHAFTKKTQKTPHKEIKIAEKRKKEWENKHGL